LVDQEIAKIEFDSEKKQVLNIIVLRKKFRFRCKRCAVFCCKLGGPPVTESDLKRIAKMGLNPYEYVEPLTSRHNWRVDAVGALKRKKDGSCIFLKYDESAGLYECRIYESRPSLCRLYPFEFIREREGIGALRFISCCNGLNAYGGRIIDREYIEKNLLDAILELI